MAVFATAPTPGATKPGLVPALGADGVADLSRALLLDTVETLERNRYDLAIAFAPSNARRSLERLLGGHRHLVGQGAGKPGERLERVLAILFERARGPVVAITADGFGTTSERLRRASAALEEADAVIGPRRDGGLDLLGLRSPRPGLAREIHWATERAGADAADALGDAGLRVAMLDPMRSLETLDDLFEWYAEARAAQLAETHPRALTTLHALLPPRRFAALEEAVRGAADA